MAGGSFPVSRRQSVIHSAKTEAAQQPVHHRVDDGTD